MRCDDKSELLIIDSVDNSRRMIKVHCNMHVSPPTICPHDKMIVVLREIREGFGLMGMATPECKYSSKMVIQKA